MEREEDEVVGGVTRMLRRRMEDVEVEVVKALAVEEDEPRVEAKRSREWLWRGMVSVCC
jgi:hypothetical protein